MKLLRKRKIAFLTLIGIYLCFSSVMFAESQDLPYSVGEKLKFTLYVSGLKVGYQTIELTSGQPINGVETYVIKGLTKTSPFVSIFYRLDDKWTIYIEKDSLLPVIVEKDYEEGKKSGYYVYNIDQKENLVIRHNKETGDEKQFRSENYVFDLFSLIYFIRANPYVIKNTTFTFDFLQPKSVRTVHFKDTGEVEIKIPLRAPQKSITAHKIEQIGGIGIELFVGKDDLRLPLIMVVPTKLSKNKKIDLELYLTGYSPGVDQKDIPKIYRRLRKR